MTNEVLIVEETELLVVGDVTLELLEIVGTHELIDIAGPQGPPGEGKPGGTAGQIYTIDVDGVTRIWADPAVSGATPADIANVTAFAAANG